MIDVKQAVSNASEFFKSLYDVNKLDNLMLEEVAVSDDERYWFVTFGFSDIQRQLKPPESHPLDILKTYQPVRIYKIIKVDAKTGQALSMKIREIRET